MNISRNHFRSTQSQKVEEVQLHLQLQLLILHQVQISTYVHIIRVVEYTYTYSNLLHQLLPINAASRRSGWSPPRRKNLCGTREPPSGSPRPRSTRAACASPGSRCVRSPSPPSAR